MSATPADYKEALLRETREEKPAKADAKASILLAASGIAYAALLTVGSASTWYPDALRDHTAALCTWAALGLSLAGIVFVAAAVKPRLRAKRPPREKPEYYGDVEAFWPRAVAARKHPQAPP